MIGLAEQQLRKAGWYPGRKVDISDQIAFWENLGYPTFDAAIKFMEEFGKLHIVDRFIFKFNNSIIELHQTTFVTEILKHYHEYSDEEKHEFNLFGMNNKKILPIFSADGEYTVFISETGEFYIDAGLIAENTEQFWNEKYGDEMGLALSWEKLARGEKRQIMKVGVREYL